MGSNDNAYVVLTNFLKKMAKIGNGYLRVIVLSSNFGGKIHVNVVVLQKFDVDILGKDFLHQCQCDHFAWSWESPTSEDSPLSSQEYSC